LARRGAGARPARRARQAARSLGATGKRAPATEPGACAPRLAAVLTRRMPEAETERMQAGDLRKKWQLQEPASIAMGTVNDWEHYLGTGSCSARKRRCAQHRLSITGRRSMPSKRNRPSLP